MNENILPPLNDNPCLNPARDEACAFMQTSQARAVADQLESLDELIALVDSLEFRADTGDPNDGPRVQCDVSQRLRVPASDPNCYEATVFFVAVAPLIDPDIRVSMATLQMDEGLHTFPVIFRDDGVYPVVLNPGSAPPRNVMTAALYDIRNMSPAARDNVGPWFVQVSRNVCEENGMDDIYERAMETLRNALLTGEPIEDPEDVEYLVSLTQGEADLFGNMGRAAHERVCRSLRNFGIALDTKRVRKALDSMLNAARPLAGDAIKMALIAEFGPAAAIALHGVNLDTMDSRMYELQYSPPEEDDEDEDEDESEDDDQAEEPERTRARKHKKTPEERRRDMARLALNFRNPST